MRLERLYEESSLDKTEGVQHRQALVTVLVLINKYNSNNNGPYFDKHCEGVAVALRCGSCKLTFVFILSFFCDV